jgi:hypothetical protein
MNTEELKKRFRELCERQLNPALDERNPNPYPAAQTYLLLQMLERLEDIYATVAAIEERINAE